MPTRKGQNVIDKHGTKHPDLWQSAFIRRLIDWLRQLSTPTTSRLSPGSYTRRVQSWAGCMSPVCPSIFADNRVFGEGVLWRVCLVNPDQDKPVLAFYQWVGGWSEELEFMAVWQTHKNKPTGKSDCTPTSANQTTHCHTLSSCQTTALKHSWPSMG